MARVVKPRKFMKSADACARKRPYPSQGEAVFAARCVEEKIGKSFVVYCCPRCGEHHVASCEHTGQGKNYGRKR